MYKNEFKKLIRTKIPNATLLYGECKFSIESQSKELQEAMQNADVFKFYFNEYEAKGISEILSNPSLFANKTLVVLKIDSINSKLLSDIKNFLNLIKKTPSSYLIIEFYNNGDSAKYNANTKSLSKLFNNSEFVFVRFFKLKHSEAIEILIENAKELKLNINSKNLAYLYETQKQQIELCISELGKLAIFDNEISKNDIDEICYGVYTNSIEELCEALINRKNYIQIAKRLEDEGILQGEIISFMQYYFYRLFLFFSYIKLNGNVDSKAIIGHVLPRDIEEKYTKYAIKLKIQDYLKIFVILSDWLLKVRKEGEKNYFGNLINLNEVFR